MKSRKRKTDFDYKALFVIGVGLIGVGVTFFAAVNRAIGISMMGLGIIYMIIAIKNKDKWKK